MSLEDVLWKMIGIHDYNQLSLLQQLIVEMAHLKLLSLLLYRSILCASMMLENFQSEIQMKYKFQKNS